jgi:hypothetical protein
MYFLILAQIKFSLVHFSVEYLAFLLDFRFPRFPDNYHHLRQYRQYRQYKQDVMILGILFNETRISFINMGNRFFT